MLDDLIIPVARLLSISESWSEIAWVQWLWGAVAQWSEHLQLKHEVLGFFVLFSLLDANGMKDL